MIIMGEFAYEHSGKDLLLLNSSYCYSQFSEFDMGTFPGRIKFTLTEER